jgi:hypothetical protein
VIKRHKLLNLILILCFLLFTEIYIKYIINYENEAIIFGQYENLNINNTRNFSKDNITIVTGYQRIKSKHRFSDYNHWITNLLKINKSMIFFIDKSIAYKIIYKRPKEYLNKTIWIPININEFYSYKNFFNEFKKSYLIDVEYFRHNSLLYTTWAEKVIFLKKAAVKNHFNSKCFYWVDAGNFRNKSNIKDYINWPSTSKCYEDGRVIINEKLKVSNYIKNGLKRFDINIHKKFQKNYNVDASTFGGQRDFIIKFSDIYYDTIRLFIKKNIFIGKEQNVMAYVFYFYPNISHLVYSGRWKYMLEYLS